jgi:hypothetical protein
MPSGIPIKMPEGVHHTPLYQHSLPTGFYFKFLNVRQLFLRGHTVDRVFKDVSATQLEKPFCQWLPGNDGV